MKTVIASIFLCAPLFSGQAFTTPTTTSITWPVDFPSLQNAYVEIGVDIVGNCTTAFGVNNTANFVNVTLGNAATHRFGVGCNAVGTKAIHVSADNGTTPVQVVSDADMTGVTTAVFRHTRDYDNNQKVFEAFRPDGTLIGSVSYLPGNSKARRRFVPRRPAQSLYRGRSFYRTEWCPSAGFVRTRANLLSMVCLCPKIRLQQSATCSTSSSKEPWPTRRRVRWRSRTPRHHVPAEYWRVVSLETTPLPEQWYRHRPPLVRPAALSRWTPRSHFDGMTPPRPHIHGSGLVDRRVRSSQPRERDRRRSRVW